MVPPAVLAALRAGLDDPDAEVAAACLRALGARADLANDGALHRRCREVLLHREPAPRRAALSILLGVMRAQERRGQPLDGGLLRAVLSGLGTGDLGPAEIAGLGALCRADGSGLLRRALVVGLRGSAWQLRPLCAQALGAQRHLGEVALALRQCLSDAEPPVRAACAEAFGEGEVPWDQETRRDLLAALSDPQPMVRAAAARTLCRAAAEEEIREALLPGTRDVSGRARSACFAALLPYVGEARIALCFTEGLADPYWPVADLCARALGRPSPFRPPPSERSLPGQPLYPHPLRGEPLSAPELLAGLHHADPDVQLYAAAALASRSPEEEVRRALCSVLLRTDEPDHARVLPAWMHSPPVGHGRAACALSLSAVCEDPTVRRALLDGLRDPHGEVREACARALVPVASRVDVQEALRALYRDGDEDARRAAADGLAGRPLDAEARALLLDGLNGQGAELREVCAGALSGALPDGPVEAALLRALADTSVAVRRAAALSLAADRSVLAKHREALLQGIKGADSALRDGAARALSGIATEVSDVLFAALREKGGAEPAFRLSLVRSLAGALPLPAVQAALVQELEQGDAQLRACCAELCAPIAAAPAAAAALLRGLRDPDRFVARTCARVLGAAHEGVRSLLLDQLADRSQPEDVRSAAAKDLSAAATEPLVTVALLRHLRTDASAAVRRACAEALVPGT